MIDSINQAGTWAIPWMAGRRWLAMMVLSAVWTTAGIERVVAQNSPTASTSTVDESGETAQVDATPSAVQRSRDSSSDTVDSENDLLARIRDCEVLTVSGDEFHAIFTVSGQVVSPAGDPVAGAIVLLRESSTSRISSEPQTYLYQKDRHLLRARDVFARTTTNAEGQFKFREVKSPAVTASRSNDWRGDVVAAHGDLGVGWLALANKKETRRVDSDLTVVLRPESSISGRFVSPQETAIQDATVNLYRLVKPRKRGLSRLGGDLDLQMSQLAPRARTDSQGRFEMTGIPGGFVATMSTNHPEWMLSGAAIATSDEIPLGKRDDHGDYVRNMEVLGVPAEVMADPGVAVSGRVVDPDGKPVSDVRVSYSSSIIREETNDQGEFRLRIATSWLDRDRERGESKSKLYAFAPPESGLLARYHEVPVDDLAAEKPVTIELERGVMVSGSVVTEDNRPVVGAMVRPVSSSRMYGATTDAKGAFELLVSPGKHVIMFGSEESGFALPSRTDLFRVRSEEDAMKLPHRRVDVSDGASKQVPPLVVSTVTSFQLIASLPDGKPAIGATAMIKDELARGPSGSGRIQMPARIVDRSSAVMTNQLGRAELVPQGVPTEKAFVEVKLATDQQAYDASVTLDQAVGGVLTVVLTSAWIVEGRVLIDEQPVVGARVSIGQSTSYQRTVNGRTFSGATVSNHIQAVTDAEGWYRAAVPQGKEYSVSLQSLPDDPEARPGIGYRPTPAGEGKLRVKDFLFSRGDQEIAGRVIDPQGNGIAGAYVQVLRGRGTEPGFWVGHRSDSQHETDSEGRFHLKRVPAGSYQLSIRGPRTENQRRSVSTMVMADAGTMDVEVTLNAEPPPTIPRLQPKSIHAIEPAETQP